MLTLAGTQKCAFQAQLLTLSLILTQNHDHGYFTLQLSEDHLPKRFNNVTWASFGMVLGADILISPAASSSSVAAAVLASREISYVIKVPREFRSQQPKIRINKRWME